LHGSSTPEDEKYDRDIITFEKVNKGIYYTGILIGLLLWEKYKLDNKTTDDLIKNVFASPHKVIDDFVEEIKKDKDRLILKNVLFDLSTSMENLIIKKIHNTF
jgi:hypothetical protein